MPKTLEEKIATFKSSYSGRKLLSAHPLEEEGIWEVRGESPNRDVSETCYEPLLGYFEGRLCDVIELAVTLPKFWHWGYGGRILKKTKDKIIKVTKDTPHEQKELRKKIATLEKELAELRKKLI